MKGCLLSLCPSPGSQDTAAGSQPAVLFCPRCRPSARRGEPRRPTRNRGTDAILTSSHRERHRSPSLRTRGHALEKPRRPMNVEARSPAWKGRRSTADGVPPLGRLPGGRARRPLASRRSMTEGGPRRAARFERPSRMPAGSGPPPAEHHAAGYPNRQTSKSSASTMSPEESSNPRRRAS